MTFDTVAGRNPAPPGMLKQVPKARKKKWDTLPIKTALPFFKAIEAEQEKEAHAMGRTVGSADFFRHVTQATLKLAMCNL